MNKANNVLATALHYSDDKEEPQNVADAVQTCRNLSESKLEENINLSIYSLKNPPHVLLAHMLHS